MVQLGSKLEVGNFLLLVYASIILSSRVSCRDFLTGERKTLELTSSATVQNNVESMLTVPSSVCRIVQEEGDTKYCFGVLLSSRWLLIAASCAPTDTRLSDNHVKVVCRTAKSSTTRNQEEFDVVEVDLLISAATGGRQEPDMALLKLNTDAPGPYFKLEMSDGPDFYTLEKHEVMKTYFNVSDLAKEQTQGSRQNSNIDLIGLPLIMNSTAMNNEDASENELHQITICCLATTCQVSTNGVAKCTFSRITPLIHKSICLATGICNEVPSASRVPSSFHRSLSASTNEETCNDSFTLHSIENCRPVPPFLQPCCSIETLTTLSGFQNKRQPFVDKVEKNDASNLEELILCSPNFDVNSTDSKNNTLLHNAAGNNSSKTAKVLCDLHIDTEVKNEKGDTALISAAKNNSVEVLEVILNVCEHVNVNATDNESKTALHYAAYETSKRMAQLLCKAHIDTEIRNERGRTALLDAAKNNGVEVLEEVLNVCEHVNVNVTDNERKTALHYAVYMNSMAMAQLLCDAHIDTEIKNQGGRTALLAAAYNDRLEGLEGIVNHCANVNVNAKGNHDKTALHYAAASDSSYIAQVLCEVGIDAEVRNQKHRTALVVAAHHNHTRPLEAILNNCTNVTIDAQDFEKRTALHYAARHCNFEMAEVLTEQNASRFIEDNKGKTPYDLIPSPSVNCSEATAEKLRDILDIVSNQKAGQATGTGRGFHTSSTIR